MDDTLLKLILSSFKVSSPENEVNGKGIFEKTRKSQILKKYHKKGPR